MGAKPKQKIVECMTPVFTNKKGERMKNSYVITSFRMPIALENRMQKKITGDGCGPRGKSKWLCREIERFLLTEKEGFVVSATKFFEDITSHGKSICFRPTTIVQGLLRTWSARVREASPEMDGVKSKIIRAAVMDSLFDEDLGLFLPERPKQAATSPVNRPCRPARQ